MEPSPLPVGMHGAAGCEVEPTGVPPALHDAVRGRLLAAFPALAGVLPATVVRLVEHGRLMPARAGDTLFSPGGPCEHLPFVLDGRIRVMHHSPEGRSIQLYTVLAGESCMMSSRALLGGLPLEATGLADTAVELLAVPVRTVEALMVADPSFRRLLFRLISERMNDLIALVDAVAFHRLDQRLAAMLIERAPSLHVTHQRLADDLGVAREMVSRVLRGFAERGWIAQHREEITVVDLPALDRVAQTHGGMRGV